MVSKLKNLITGNKVKVGNGEILRYTPDTGYTMSDKPVSREKAMNWLLFNGEEVVHSCLKRY